MKVLFYSPHAFIDVHSEPESIVAMALKSRGHEILQVVCNGAFKKYCISMSAAGVWPEDSDEAKENICIQCKLKRDSLIKKFNFQTIFIDDFLCEDDYVMIDDLIQQINKDNWEDFEFEGIQTGRISAYEFFLTYKLNTKNLSPKEWEAYKIYLQSCLRSQIAAKKIINKFSPDSIVGYNLLYSVMHAAHAISLQKNIPSYFLHAGSHHLYRTSEMTIFKGLIPASLINKSAAWLRYSKYPLSRRAIDKASLHVKELLEATSPWVYSIKSQGITSDKLRENLGISSSQKVLLVTMSSADERFAADFIGALPEYLEPIFPTQFSWIHFLIDYAKNNPNVFLIIRAHPREFPNKREGVLSKQAIKIQDEFTNLPNNCFLNLPSDEISLHDLIKITDVGLNSTSTSGLELLLFGIPVVIYDANQLFSYPADLNLHAKSIEDYIEKINEALTSGLSIVHIIQAYKWIAFKSDVASIDISSDYVGYDAVYKKSWIRSIIHMFYQRKNLQRGLHLKEGKRIKNAYWLSYAIENQTESHMDRYVKYTYLRTVFISKFRSENYIRSKITKLIKSKFTNNDPEYYSRVKNFLKI